jgi:hypothetical protein
LQPGAVATALRLRRGRVVVGLELGGRGGARPDAGAPRARGGEDASVFHEVIARGWDADREAAEQGERVHVDGDGAVGVSALERDAHEAFGPLLGALLRERRAHHVAEQCFATEGVERTGARRCVEGKAVERSAEGLVEAERARRERWQAAEPLRAGRRLAAEHRARSEGGLAVVIAVAIAVAVTELEQASAPEVIRARSTSRCAAFVDRASRASRFCCLA